MVDALDQRISKDDLLSPKVFFFYDPVGQLIGEYRDNAATTTPTDDWLLRQETIWLADIPVAVLRKPVTVNPIQIFTSIRSSQYTEIIVNQNGVLMRNWADLTHSMIIC